MAKKTGLGQGVGLLFGEEKEKFFNCEIDRILPNKFQPRTYFDADQLKELSDSIRENGVIQPLVVREQPDGDLYELIAGERRLRASKLAGLTSVPVVVLDIDTENSLLEMALVENIQRTDLNPLEEAEAYQNLIDKFGYTQEETAKKVGKKRSTVTNTLRLLKLPNSIQSDIISGLLSEGHARSLLKLVDNEQGLNNVRDLIVKDNLSVRETEKLVKKVISQNLNQNQSRSTPVTKQEAIPSSYKSSLETQLTNKLNSKISIVENGSRGKIEIEYYSFDDLERLFSLLLD